VRVEAVKALSDLLRSEARYEACIPAMGKLLDDPDWRVRVAVCDGVTTSGFASEKLREIARTAMPRLIELASDEHAEVRRAALTAIGSIPSDVSDAELLPTFARALADDSPEVVAAAARWFGYEAEIGNLRPVPSPVVDSLRGLLASPHATVRWSAASAVWNTTHDSAGVVPVLAEQVAESRGVDLIDPLRLLQEIGPDAESAVPAILSVLTEGTFARKWGTGTEAMDALYAIGPPTATTLPLLETMLADATWAARREAAYAVATLDGDAAACEAVLARALSRERDPRVRGAIHRSRGAIGVGGDALVADLVRGLSTSDHEPWGETWGAIDGLRLMGPRAVAAMPALEPLVPFDENSNRPKAATALATIGGPSRAAEMLSRTKDNDDHVNGDVERIVEAVGPADAAIVPVLLRHIDESPFVIARALAEIGPAAKDALPALGRRMSGSSEEERVAAAEAVLRIGGDRDAALQVLVDAVDSTAALHESRSDEDLGTEAVYALGRSGDAARPAVAALRQSATRDGFEKQQAAAFALWRISGEVEPCVEAAIVAVLESYSSTPPTELVESLGAIGPSAAPATSALVGVALRCRDFSWDDQWKDSKVDVCRTTVRALGRIGPGAASALPTLRKLRRNALFRDAAEEAIRRIEAK
jgi:HEAT repeat protein